MLDIKIKGNSNITREVERRKEEIKCPECEAKLTITLGQMAREKSLPCPGCKKNIPITGDGGKIQKMLNDLKDIDKTISSLG